MHLFEFDSKFRAVSLGELNIGNNIHGDGEPIINIPGIMRNQGLVERGYDIISGIFKSTANPNIILWVSLVAVTPAGMVETNVQFNHEEVIELSQKPAFKNWFGNKKTQELVEQSERANKLPVSTSDNLPIQFNGQSKPGDGTQNYPIDVRIVQEIGIGYRVDDTLKNTMRFLKGYIDEEAFFLDDIIDMYIARHQGRG